jgi:ABC-type nitrate/sulfonate/bicarbonate transport system substrate-binding protein
MNEPSRNGALTSRRSVLGGLVAAPFILTGTGPVNAQSVRTVKMAAQNPLQLSDYPNLIAERFGLFARHGIKAEFVPATNALLPLLSGDIDITTVGALNGLLPIARKQDFQFIGTTVPGAVATLLVRPDSSFARVAHKWPESFRQLRGKTLGVTIPGGVNDMLARWLAVKAGLTPDKDITITPAGDAAVLLANLEKGVYDAAYQISPLFERAQERRIAVSILDFYRGEGPSEVKTVGFATPGARKSFADKNPDVINRYLAGIQEAADFAAKAENRGAITDMVAKELKADPKTLEGPINTFLASVGRSVKFPQAQWDIATAIMKTNGVLKDEVSFSEGVYAGAR